jgi:hypothetical protein
MAKELPPYVSSTGLLQELFKKIQEAPPPARFSQDYLFTNLKFKKSGSTLPFIPFLKRIGFLSNDSAPTEIYKRFRNPNPAVSGQAIAEAFKLAYKDLYARNEYWHKLTKDDLKNFLIEVLEVEPKNAALGYLIRTVETLKKYANFSEVPIDVDGDDEEKNEEENDEEEKGVKKANNKKKEQPSDLEGLNLSYTINLNLPETSDGKVFDAIFKSLKEHLLKK